MLLRLETLDEELEIVDWELGIEDCRFDRCLIECLYLCRNNECFADVIFLWQL